MTELSQHDKSQFLRHVEGVFSGQGTPKIRINDVFEIPEFSSLAALESELESESGVDPTDENLFRVGDILYYVTGDDGTGSPRTIAIGGEDIEQDRGNVLGGNAVEDASLAVHPEASVPDSTWATAIGGGITPSQQTLAISAPDAGGAFPSVTPYFGSIAIGIAGNGGSGANTTAPDSVAIGSGVEAGFESVAIGGTSQAPGLNSFAANSGTAEGSNSVAIAGGSVTGGSSHSVAIGDVSASNSQSVVIGTNQTCSGAEAVAIGDGSEVEPSGTVAVGSSMSVTGISGNHVAIGGESTVDGSGGVGQIAIGHDVTTSATSSISVGSNSSSTGLRSISVGDGASASADAAVAEGYSSSADGSSSVAVSNGANSQMGSSVALGSFSTAGDSAAGTGTASIAIGGDTDSAQGAQATGDNSVAIGGTAQGSATVPAAGALAQGAIAIGNAGAQTASSIAIGTAALTSSAANAIAIGNGAEAGEGVAIGSSTSVSNAGDVCLGHGSGAVGGGSVAIGQDSNADGSSLNSIAIGDTATTSATGAVSIGGSTSVGTANVGRVGVDQLVFGAVQDTLADANLNNSELTLDIDETNGQVIARLKNSAGAVKQSTVLFDENVYEATETATGDGATTSFSFAHGLPATPSNVQVTPKTEDAAADFWVTEDATNITINYSAAPTDTNSLEWDIEAEV